VIGALGTLARHGRPDILLYFGRSPGDSLLCTAVLHELRARGAGRLWMQSDQPELFERNSDVDRVVPYDRSIRRLTRLLGGRVVFPDYAPYDAATDRSRPPDLHIIACMCRALGVTGEVGLRPYLALADDERRLGRLAPRQVAIQSTGASARLPMRNKEWGAERFQAVARELRSRYDLVQLGTPADPPIHGAIDERGAPLRRAAAILSQSMVFVGLVGFLMHLARAVECRSVIVYGGREAPWQSGYTGNENLGSAVPCSPCWLWNRCDYDRRCLAEITPSGVVAAIDRAAARSGERLAVDTQAL
jgi:hypothetical protein